MPTDRAGLVSPAEGGPCAHRITQSRPLSRGNRCGCGAPHLLENGSTGGGPPSSSLLRAEASTTTSNPCPRVAHERSIHRSRHDTRCCHESGPNVPEVHAEFKLPPFPLSRRKKQRTAAPDFQKLSKEKNYSVCVCWMTLLLLLLLL